MNPRYALAIALAALVLGGCAEWRRAGREIGAAGKAVGHEVRDAAVEVGKGAKEAGKDLGNATAEAAKEVKEEVKKK